MKNIEWTAISVVALLVTFGVFMVYIVCNNVNKRDELFAKNMETAISKGVDPIAVRCAYNDARDDICITYITTHK